ncbi:MAG: AbrB/MazE/SpoVT family DNA-binding domain-containing protein [Bacilli bacterium]|nr:AbrB/MazE/SpoVT family DNA-binding domain-containing protein [Bacilli bacterium]MDD4809238.1 AbrB/MazE/SpoVT family DNA-binding domain-containing protein [Bacilli bacterium]
MIRSIDELGRFVIPKEIRKNMNLVTGDLLQLELINNSDDLLLVISKEESIAQCLGCGAYCRSNDNFCSNCGLYLKEDPTLK